MVRHLLRTCRTGVVITTGRINDEAHEEENNKHGVDYLEMTGRSGPGVERISMGKEISMRNLGRIIECRGSWLTAAYREKKSEALRIRRSSGRPHGRKAARKQPDKLRGIRFHYTNRISLGP